MTTATFRQINASEKEILSRLLEADFPARDVVCEQVLHAVVRTIDAEGSLEFQTTSSQTIPPGGRVRVEARYRDLDEVYVNLLLHIADGKVRELEVYKDDGSPIRTAPNADLLERWPD